MSLKGHLDSMLCIIGFYGVLGSVKGVVQSVGFGVLSTSIIFTLDAIVDKTTLGSN